MTIQSKAVARLSAPGHRSQRRNYAEPESRRHTAAHGETSDDVDGSHRLAVADSCRHVVKPRREQASKGDAPHADVGAKRSRRVVAGSRLRTAVIFAITDPTYVIILGEVRAPDGAGRGLHGAALSGSGMAFRPLSLDRAARSGAVPLAWEWSQPFGGVRVPFGSLLGVGILPEFGRVPCPGL